MGFQSSCLNNIDQHRIMRLVGGLSSKLDVLRQDFRTLRADIDPTLLRKSKTCGEKRESVAFASETPESTDELKQLHRNRDELKQVETLASEIDLETQESTDELKQMHIEQMSEQMLEPFVDISEI